MNKKNVVIKTARNRAFTHLPNSYRAKVQQPLNTAASVGAARAVMVLRGDVGKSEADFLRNDSIGPDGTGSTRDLRPDPWPGSPALRVMARGYSPELMKPS